MKNVFVKLLMAATLAASGAAHAVPTPYSPAGTQNTAVYTFTAASTGDIIGYFAGSTATYENDMSLLVNGIAVGGHGLNNQTSVYGQAFNFGSVSAGDILVFVLTNIRPGGVGPWYSQTSLNSDLVNHVYSNEYAGDSLIGAGTYVAFEDLNNGGNFNYDDISFVFSNVNTEVPEPASVALLGAGVFAIAISRRRKNKLA
jgi:hypothetical protein